MEKCNVLLQIKEYMHEKNSILTFHKHVLKYLLLRSKWLSFP